jgi:hypothetical protein
MDEIGKIDGAHLVLQVHMDKAPGLDEEALRAGCQKLVEAGWAARLSFVRSQEDGDHIDAGFETFNAEELWAEIQSFLMALPGIGEALRSAMVAVRTGKSGWDDSILLYEYPVA